MLRKKCFSLVIVLFFGISVFGQQTKAPRAANKKPRTVVDFLLLLPKNYVGNYTISARQKFLKQNGTTDAANGYLEFGGAGENDAFVVAAIFKKDDGDYLITTAISGAGAQKLYFLDYDGKKFVNAAKRVLPADFGAEKINGDYNCELPRYNRTINCRDAAGKLTYLGWTGKEFVIE